MALVHGSASTRPPAADAATPLRSLAPATEAKLATRAAAGLPAIGADYPRRRVWQRVVIPSGGLAVLDLLGVIVGFARGQVLLAVFALVLFVPFTAMALLGARFAASDPLRLGPAENRAITAARHWQSRQDWTGPLAGGEERGVVIAAVDAAERIARTPAWRSGTHRRAARAPRPGLRARPDRRAGPQHRDRAPAVRRRRSRPDPDSRQGLGGRRRPRRGPHRLRRRARQLRATSPRAPSTGPARPSARPCPAARPPTRRHRTS